MYKIGVREKHIYTCTHIYIYNINTNPTVNCLARSTSAHGRIEIYSVLCRILECRHAVELYYLVGLTSISLR